MIIVKFLLIKSFDQISPQILDFAYALKVPTLNQTLFGFTLTQYLYFNFSTAHHSYYIHQLA